MECRITSRAKQRCAGFSFAELLTALALSSLVSVVLVSLSFYSARQFMARATDVELASSSRHAVDTLTSDLRQMISITAFSTNALSVLDINGNPTVYSWSPYTRALQRTTGGVSKSLLVECESLAFSLYKASPVDGALDLEPTTKIKEAKAIKFEWVCGRTNSSVVAKVRIAQTVVLRLQGL